MLAVAFLAPILWILGGLVVGGVAAGVLQSTVEQREAEARQRFINTTSLIGGVVLASLFFFRRGRKR